MWLEIFVTSAQNRGRQRFSWKILERTRIFIYLKYTTQQSRFIPGYLAGRRLAVRRIQNMFWGVKLGLKNKKMMFLPFQTALGANLIR